MEFVSKCVFPLEFQADTFQISCNEKKNNHEKWSVPSIEWETKKNLVQFTWHIIANIAIENNAKATRLFQPNVYGFNELAMANNP